MLSLEKRQVSLSEAMTEIQLFKGYPKSQHSTSVLQWEKNPRKQGSHGLQRPQEHVLSLPGSWGRSPKTNLGLYIIVKDTTVGVGGYWFLGIFTGLCLQTTRSSQVKYCDASCW